MIYLNNDECNKEIPYLTNGNINNKKKKLIEEMRLREETRRLGVR